MFDGVVIGEYGPWTLVGVFFLFVFTGLLLPRRWHNERIKDKDEQITKLQAALDKRDEQFAKLMAQNEVTIKLLEDIRAIGLGREVEPV